jgi:hypothetical protein
VSEPSRDVGTTAWLSGKGFSMSTSYRSPSGLIQDAWVDESIRTVGEPMYLLGASITTTDSYDAAAELLRSFAPRGKKLHWRDLGDAGRKPVVDALPDLHLHHVVVVGTPMVGIREERARGRCFERLLWELDRSGVTKVVFESRTRHQDQTDRRRVDGLRSRGVITGGLRAEWRRGAEEPLLWAADVVLGAVGDARVAGRQLDARLAASIQEIVISL